MSTEKWMQPRVGPVRVSRKGQRNRYPPKRLKKALTPQRLAPEATGRLRKILEASDLNIKQRQFVCEYLRDFHGTNAAIRAGYKAKAAYAQANKLLKQVEIRSILQQFEAKQIELADVTATNVLLEAARLTFSDLRRLFDADDEMLPIHQWPDDIARAVSSVEMHEDGGGIRKVRTWPKAEPMKLLAAHLRLTGPNPEPPADPKDTGPAIVIILANREKKDPQAVSAVIDVPANGGRRNGPKSKGLTVAIEEDEEDED